MSKSLVRNKVVVITDAVSGAGAGTVQNICPHLSPTKMYLCQLQNTLSRKSRFIELISETGHLVMEL